MNIVEKFKKMLKINFTSQVNLIDGTPLELSDDLQSGVSIFILTSDGKIAMPDGEYKLEDESIITVKDGLVMDVIGPATPTEETEGLDPVLDPTTNEFATQKGNPEVTGEEPTQPKEDPNLLTGTTTETAPEVKAEDMPFDPNAPVEDVEDMPIEDMPMVDPKIAELESKIADMEKVLGEIASKLNMVAEKFSAANPIIKKKEDNGTSLMNPKLQSRVDLINTLKKNK